MIAPVLAAKSTPASSLRRRLGGGCSPSRRCILEIETIGVLFGDLPHRVLGMLVEWAASHRAELEENWSRARARAPLTPIRPLK